MLKRSSLVCLSFRFDVLKGRFVDMAGKEEADLEGFTSEVDVEAAAAGDTSREPEDRGDIGKDLGNCESGKSQIASSSFYAATASCMMPQLAMTAQS
jgi:hypothetical protein